jgi:hypothetical protein
VCVCARTSVCPGLVPSLTHEVYALFVFPFYSVLCIDLAEPLLVL